MDDYEEMKQVFQIVAPGKQDDPELLQFYNDLRDRHIWLEDSITWEDDSWIIKYLQWLNRNDNSMNPKPVYLHIYSNGGELCTAFALYHAVRNSRIPVYTINEGACHSAAFMIFLAGAERMCTPYSSWVAHEGYGGTGGSYRESKAAMKDYERDVAMMKEIISTQTHLSLEEIEHHFEEQQDWYIYPDEAFKYGILTKDPSAPQGTKTDIKEKEV